MNPYMNKEKVFENSCRRQATRLGLRLIKSRARLINIDDFGDYMLVDIENNAVVAGSRFDLELDEVKKWLDEYEKNILVARAKI